MILAASAGIITRNGTNAAGTWSWSFTPVDNDETQTVTVTATDNNAGRSSTTFPLVVDNVAPTATFNAPASVPEGGAIDLSLTNPSDVAADVAEGFTYAFDCGDGSGYGSFTTSNSTSCPTSASGTRTVKGQIRDADLEAREYMDEVAVADTTAPDTTITAGPSGLTNQTSASFTFTSTEANNTFACSLDGGTFSACTSPRSCSGLSQDGHTFEVRATDPPATSTPTRPNGPGRSTALPPRPRSRQGGHADQQHQRELRFTSNEGDSTFACSLDGADFSACSNPQSYGSLTDGPHTFAVKRPGTTRQLQRYGRARHPGRPGHGRGRGGRRRRL